MAQLRMRRAAMRGVVGRGRAPLEALTIGHLRAWSWWWDTFRA